MKVKAKPENTVKEKGGEKKRLGASQDRGGQDLLQEHQQLGANKPFGG